MHWRFAALAFAFALGTGQPALGQTAKPAAASSSSEMKAIFDADQAARSDPTTINWDIVNKQDEARRVRTKQLLDSGALTTADDFYHAAFVFQHGGDPKSYLLAHTLAIAAVAKGHPEASWIAAASLDRYLQAIGQPQIYGTQFVTTDGQNTTQEPYDRTLVSDPLRAIVGVPALADQEVRRREIEARYRNRAAQKKSN